MKNRSCRSGKIPDKKLLFRKNFPNWLTNSLRLIQEAPPLNQLHLLSQPKNLWG